MSFQEILELTYAGNEVRAYLSMAVFIVVTYFLFHFAVERGISALKNLTKKTQNRFDDYIVDVLGKVKWPAFFFITLYGARSFLIMPTWYGTFVRYAFIIFLVYEGVRITNSVIDLYIARCARKKDISEYYYLLFFGKFFKFFTWIIGALLIVDNLGYNVSSLIAGLGIGGIAIALAVQNILGDMFSSLSLYFDKPFKVNDFIVLGARSGRVKSIGIKTTRVTTLEGPELVVPNSKLTSMEVENFGKMEKRRVLFVLGVAYGTTRKKLENIPAMIEGIIKKTKKSEFSRCYFKEFGPSSLNYEVVYYVETPEFEDYMQTLNHINIEIHEAFKKAKIEIAYPTQTVYVKK